MPELLIIDIDPDGEGFTATISPEGLRKAIAELAMAQSKHPGDHECVVTMNPALAAVLLTAERNERPVATVKVRRKPG